MATNTLQGVNPTRISQLTLDALETLRLPFSAFTTDFSPDVARAGDAVTTRFVTNPSVQNFSSSKASANAATTSRTINLQHYSGVSLGFSDTEMSFSDVKLMDMFVVPAITALFENVMANVWGRVLAASFSSNTVVTAANFNASAVAGLAQSLNEAKVQANDRHIIVPPSYAVSLKKDTAIQASYAYGSPEAIRTGRLPDVYGFRIHEWNGTIPNNSENLAGIACAPQGLIIAVRPPALPQNWYGKVSNVTDPETGLTIQMREYYDGSEQRVEWCFIYGTGIGVTGNLHRIRSGS